MHGVVFNRKGNLFGFRKIHVKALILSSKYISLAAKGSVSNCNMTCTRSIFASLALQLFLSSRQVHTSLPQLLEPSWPRDRGKHSLFCFWTLKQRFSSICRSRSHSGSFWVKDKFTRIPQLFQPSWLRARGKRLLDLLASHNVFWEAPTRVEEKGVWFRCFS